MTKRESELESFKAKLEKLTVFYETYAEDLRADACRDPSHERYDFLNARALQVEQIVDKLRHLLNS